MIKISSIGTTSSLPCDVCGDKSMTYITLEICDETYWLCEECSQGLSKLHNKHMEKRESYAYSPADGKVVKLDGIE